MIAKTMARPFGDERPDEKRRQLNDEGLRILMILYRIIGSAKRHFQPILSRHGLSGAQLWTLWQVSAEPGLSVGQLARRLSIHPSTTSNLVEQLQAKGLVYREKKTGQDRRIVRIFPSDSGKKAVDAALRADSAFSDLIEGLSARQLHRVNHTLQLLLWQLPPASGEDLMDR